MEGGVGPFVERAAELTWIADLEGEINSDLSAFHRIDDPMSMGSAQYVQMAVHLPAYQGAVASAIGRIQAEAAPVADPGLDAYGGAPVGVPPYAAGVGAPAVDDIAALAAMSHTPGFPGIEYQGG